MRGLKKMVLVAGILALAAGACGRAEPLLTAPDGQPAADLAPPPGHGAIAPHDEPPPPADTTGRWGGGLGSGT